MAHADHDDIIEAFRRIDRSVATCDRGGAEGYTHVHGPHQPHQSDRCRSHWIVVEKVNGTVSVRDAAGTTVGGRPRVHLPIKVDPLGYSVRDDFGGFTHGLTADDIRRQWPTLDDFARDVIRYVQQKTTW